MRSRSTAAMFTLHRVCLALVLCCGPSPILADVVKPALIEISVFSAGRFRVEIRASIEALLTGINAQYQDTTQAPTSGEYDRLRELEAKELAQAFEPFQQRMLDLIELRFDGQLADAQLVEVEIPVPGYTKVPRISLIVLEGSVPERAHELTWYYPAIFGDNAVRVRQVDLANERWHWSPHQWIRDNSTSTPFSLTEVFRPPSFFALVSEYVAAGFEHIIPGGLDHVLFVLGLFLFSTRLRPLLWQVTMFTVAHSLTLAMAMTGVVDVPPRIVEPLIALSIAYVGIENLWHRRLHRSRLALVFGFGLLHGLGFASTLADFGMPQDGFFTALISFNVGVELGQLGVIGLAWLTIGLPFGHCAHYRRLIVIPGSLAIAAVGLYWAWERLSL